MRILIVSANFYADIAAELLAGAQAACGRAGAQVEVVEVPGALEIPAAIRFAMGTGRYDGFVALGCVIRGETSHYDTVCNESARGLTDLALAHQAAIGNGILTVENEAQAWVRARRLEGDKGAGAANACLQLIELKKQFGVA